MIGLDGTATHDQADARADFIGGPEKRRLSPPDTVTCLPEQRTHVAPDSSRESSHRVEGDVLEPGFDQRDVLLCQTGPRSQLSLRQASLNSGRTHILAENLPQIVGNGQIALGRLRWRTLSPSCCPRVPDFELR